MEIPSVTAKGALQFPGQHGDISSVDNTARKHTRARARLRVVRCGNRRVRRGPRLTWTSYRSPLRAHFTSRANMATFLLWIIQRARLRVVRCGNRRVRRSPMITWKSQRPLLRAHFSFQCQHGGFSLVDNTARGRARARLRVVHCGNRRARRGLKLTWQSHRSPLRAHFSFQADMATFRLWIIQRARARVCALYAAAIDGYVEAPC